MEALVRRLNEDDAVDGILVQLPLPDGLDATPILDLIDPAKDVDGLHPENVGRLSIGRPGLRPCTPKGCMRLLTEAGVELKGLRALVIGRSDLVGKPVAQLLLAEHATVTIAHSRTRDLDRRVAEADVVIAAVGRPEVVKGEWIREGATVIDVGINRVAAPELGLREDGAPKTRLVGDVEQAAAEERSGAYTPVPGGVGPMTIACLLANTLTAYSRAAGLPEPEGLTA